MSTTQNPYGTTISGLLAAFTEAFGAEPKAWAGVSAPPGTAASKATGRKRPGLLARMGEQLWRRQLGSVDLHLARSDDLFASLDRWLWKQHQRETEAWLARAVDVHDLEARIRHLERNRDGRVF